MEHLDAGDRHYKAYVGPPENYDLVGAMQFNLLTSFGLRDNDKLLDIGCGSLRSGKLMIPYLCTGNYYGLEPNKWLIEEGVKHELGNDLLRIKKPKFLYDSNFQLHLFEEKFDFIMAQSIFSHTSLNQMNNCLREVKEVLKDTGVFLATYVVGKKDYLGDDWIYPGCSRFKKKTIKKIIEKNQLQCTRLKWHHPNNQTWYAIYHPTSEEQIKKKINRLFKINKKTNSLKYMLLKFQLFNNQFVIKNYGYFKGLIAKQGQ